MTTTPHRHYNRRAFGAFAGPLPQLYGRLVALEISLKDVHGYSKDLPKTDLVKAAFGGLGHDFLKAIQEFGYPLSVTSVASTLSTQLRSLIVDKAPLGPDKYPYLRYLNHITDAPQGGSGTSDSDLQEAIRLTDALISALDKHWQAEVPPKVKVIP